METTATEEVLGLVNRWAAAELAGDVAAYETLLATDFQGIGPVGFVLDRTQWAGRHLGGDVVNEQFEILEPHVRHYRDTALVEAVQRQKTVARGHDASGSFRVLLVLVRDGEAWVIAHIQLSGPLLTPGDR
ncbi:nuclear transport factor 2 family protein [Sinomonas susongensis]|uniref:nuclear transport factor 2 family protein n=1 Tax=Sinomonas susongensis TaxID=1324851 RepID=UPI001108B878|nr:nuclear transport factor 2 family protein [Sinomonas susongensis]